MISTATLLGASILVVDDLEPNLLLLTRMLASAGYTSVTSTMDPHQVCDLYREHRYDCVLLDIMMPGIDGFQILEELKALEPGSYLPVIVVTAQPEHKLRALQVGAKDFITKPFELPEVLARVRNVLEVRLLNAALRKARDELELRIQDRTADLQDSHLETIFTVTRAAEYKDNDDGAHSRRISYYCRALSTELGMDRAFLDQIFVASPMHDIGKIGVADSIVQNPGILTREEFETQKAHAAIGAKILRNSKSPYLRMASDIALNHHERWDGSGYPSGKKGEAIPVAARIMALCDVYDAMRSKRAYKPAMGHVQATELILEDGTSEASRHFDPAVVEAFRKVEPLFADIFATYA